jgi:hypothetical protein
LYMICLELATLAVESLLATLLRPIVTLRYDEGSCLGSNP